MQDLALGLAKLHAVHAGPPLQPVKVPLNGIPSLEHVNHTAQLGVIGKLAEGALSPTVHVVDKDIQDRVNFDKKPGGDIVDLLSQNGQSNDVFDTMCQHARF